jgi:hypothetical protein
MRLTLNVLQLADNDMLVDEYEQYNHDRTDVVVVSRAGSEEPDAVPVANDCTISPLLYLPAVMWLGSSAAINAAVVVVPNL